MLEDPIITKAYVMQESNKNKWNGQSRHIDI